MRRTAWSAGILVCALAQVLFAEESAVEQQREQLSRHLEQWTEITDALRGLCARAELPLPDAVSQAFASARTVIETSLAKLGAEPAELEEAKRIDATAERMLNELRHLQRGLDDYVELDPAQRKEKLAEDYRAFVVKRLDAWCGRMAQFPTPSKDFRMQGGDQLDGLLIQGICFLKERKACAEIIRELADPALATEFETTCTRVAEALAQSIADTRAQADGGDAGQKPLRIAPEIWSTISRWTQFLQGRRRLREIENQAGQTPEFAPLLESARTAIRQTEAAIRALIVHEQNEDHNEAWGREQERLQKAHQAALELLEVALHSENELREFDEQKKRMAELIRQKPVLAKTDLPARFAEALAEIARLVGQSHEEIANRKPVEAKELEGKTQIEFLRVGHLLEDAQQDGEWFERMQVPDGKKENPGVAAALKACEDALAVRRAAKQKAREVEFRALEEENRAAMLQLKAELLREKIEELEGAVEETEEALETALNALEQMTEEEERTVEDPGAEADRIPLEVPEDELKPF